MAASTNIVGVGPIFRNGVSPHGFAECFGSGDCSGLVFEHGFAFVVMTLVLGGGCALMSGRALAVSWRPIGQLLFYMALFGLAVRFLHWGLFRGTLLTPHYYVVDTAILMLIAAASYRYTRASMMTRQYYWLYTRTGPFSWRQVGSRAYDSGQSPGDASTPRAGA